MSLIFSFVYKYFFDAIIVTAFAIVSKFALRYFSNDRWKTIKDTILTAMLWAEETYGLGSGDEKWQKAWKKIIELLSQKGIKLKEKETSLVTDIMKSNIPEINSLVYSTLPEEDLKIRAFKRRSDEAKILLEELKKKYPEGKE